MDQHQIRHPLVLSAEPVHQLNQEGLALDQQNKTAGLGIKPERIHQVTKLPRFRPWLAFSNALVDELHQTWTIRLKSLGGSEQPGWLIHRQQPFVLIENRNLP